MMSATTYIQNIQKQDYTKNIQNIYKISTNIQNIQNSHPDLQFLTFWNFWKTSKMYFDVFGRFNKLIAFFVSAVACA